MNVETLTVTQDEITRKRILLRDARKFLKRKAHEEAERVALKDYEILSRVYRLLDKGDKILDVHSAIVSAGFHANGLPKVAIARANQKFCSFLWYKNNPIATFRSFDGDYYTRWNYAKLNNWQIDFKIQFPENREREANIPKVPPEIAAGKMLSRHAILWEVDNWYMQGKNPLNPDRDPYLLLPLGGPFYKVIAEWDLTDIEFALAKHALIVNR